MSTQVRVILNSPEQHPTSGMPKALRHILYSNDPLLELIQWNGCPNNGCQHNLTVVGEAHDVNAWLDIFVETYPTTMPEIMMIKKRIREGRLNSMGEEVNSITIELKKIRRLQEIKGEVVERPWFWTPEWEEQKPCSHLHTTDQGGKVAGNSSASIAKLIGEPMENRDGTFTRSSAYMGQYRTFTFTDDDRFGTDF